MVFLYFLKNIFAISKTDKVVWVNIWKKESICDENGQRSLILVKVPGDWYALVKQTVEPCLLDDWQNIF